MNTSTALEAIQEIVRSVKKNDALIITPEMDLLEEKILDSLDGLIFFMQLDTQYGISIPEDADLAKDGYFKMEKLLSLLADRQ